MKRRSNGEGSFYPQKDKSWAYQVTYGRKEDGKPYRKSFKGRTKAICEGLDLERQTLTVNKNLIRVKTADISPDNPNIEILNKVNPHALRHTLATRLVEDRVPLNIVQGILGHASIETTRKYLHKNESIEREAIDTMSAYLRMDKMNEAPKLNGATPRAKFADIPLPVFSQKRTQPA